MKTLLKILFFPITLIVWVFKNSENVGAALVKIGLFCGFFGTLIINVIKFIQKS